MQVDTLTVVLDTDTKKLSTGLKSARADLAAFKKEVEATPNLAVTVDTSGISKATGEAKTFRSEVDKTRASAEKGIQLKTELVGQASVQAGLEALQVRRDSLSGGTITLETTLQGAQGVISDLEKMENIRTSVDGDKVTLTAELKGGEESRADIEALAEAASRIDGDTLKMSATVTGTSESIAELTALESRFDSLDGRTARLDVDSDSITQADDRIRQFSGTVRGLATVLAVANIPTFMAGIGAIPAVAAAAAAGVGALSIGIGGGLVAAATSAYGALGLAYGGIAATGVAANSAIQNILGMDKAFGSLGAEAKFAKDQVKAFEELVSVMPEGTEAATQAQNRLALAQEYQAQTTQLQIDWWGKYGEAANAAAASLYDLRFGIVSIVSDTGGQLIPVITEFIDIAVGHLPAVSDAFQVLTYGVEQGTAELRSFLESAQGISAVENIIYAVGAAAGPAMNILTNGAIVALQALQPIIPTSQEILTNLSTMATAASAWATSAEGTTVIADTWSVLIGYGSQLAGIVQNVAVGFYNIGAALYASGLVELSMGGLETVAVGFRSITTDSASLSTNLQLVGPVLTSLGGLVSVLTEQFFYMAGAVLAAVNPETGESTLVELIDSLSAAVPPLAEILVGTFEQLAPAISRNIGPISEFVGTFIGSSGTLVTVIDMLGGLAEIFLGLPAPIQSAVVEIAALSAVFSVLGGPSLVQTGAYLSIIGTNALTMGSALVSAAPSIYAFAASVVAGESALLAFMVAYLPIAALGAIAIDFIVNAPDIASAFSTTYEEAQAAGQGTASSFVEALGAGLDETVIGSVLGSAVAKAEAWIAAARGDENASLWDVIKGDAPTEESEFLMGVQSAWDSATSWLAGAAGSVAGFFAEIPSQVGSVLASLPETVGGFFQSAWDLATSTASSLVETVIGFFQNLPANAGIALGTLAGTVAGYIVEAGTYAGEAASSLVTTVVGFFYELPGMVGEALLGLGALILQTFADLGVSAYEGLVSFGATVADFFYNLPTTIYDSLASFGSSISDFFYNLPATVSEALSSFGSSVVSFFSGLPAQVGEALSGFASSVIGSFNSAKTEGETIVSTLVEDVVSYVAALPGRVYDALSTFVSSFTGAFWDAYYEVVGGSIVPDMVNEIVAWFTDLPGMIVDALGDLASYIVTPFEDAWSSITSSADSFFSSFYNDYWLYYLGTDGVVSTAVSDFFSSLYNDYFLYYLGTDGSVITAVSDFFTGLYNDYWLYYLGTDGTLITGLLDFFTSLYNDYFLYYLGTDGVVITAVSDFFSGLYNDWWLYYFGTDGTLITGISDFFTSLYNDYFLYYLGTDGTVITAVSDFFSALYNDWFLYYFGSEGLIATTVSEGLTALETSAQSTWDNIVSGVEGFASSLYTAIHDGFWTAVSAGGEALASLLDGIASALTAINDPLGLVGSLEGAASSIRSATAFAEGGVVGFAEGGTDAKRGGVSGARSPRVHVWGEGDHPEAYITKDPSVRGSNRRYAETAVGWLGGSVLWGSDAMRFARGGCAGGCGGSCANCSNKKAFQFGGISAEPVGPSVTQIPMGGENGATYNWDRDVWKIVEGIYSDISGGSNPNTYEGHPGGESRSVDWWNSYRGDQIDPAVGDEIYDLAWGKYRDRLNYSIWRGTYDDTTGYSYDYEAYDPSDAHYDHLHSTWGSTGAFSALACIFSETARGIAQSLTSGLIDVAKTGLKALDMPIVESFGDYALDGIKRFIDDTLLLLPGCSTGGRVGSSASTGGPNQANRDLGKELAEGYGWNEGAEWSALEELWNRESQWDHTAENPESGAFGIPQSLGHGDIGDDAGSQISWGLDYIYGRYGSPSAALAFHDENGWYRYGGLAGFASGGISIDDRVTEPGTHPIQHVVDTGTTRGPNIHKTIRPTMTTRSRQTRTTTGGGSVGARIACKKCGGGSGGGLSSAAGRAGGRGGNIQRSTGGAQIQRTVTDTGVGSSQLGKVTQIGSLKDVGPGTYRFASGGIAIDDRVTEPGYHPITSIVDTGTTRGPNIKKTIKPSMNTRVSGGSSAGGAGGGAGSDCSRCSRLGSGGGGGGAGGAGGGGRRSVISSNLNVKGGKGPHAGSVSTKRFEEVRSHRGGTQHANVFQGGATKNLTGGDKVRIAAEGGVLPRYHAGGVVPGTGGERMLVAEAGERLLPRTLNPAFEALADSVTSWSSNGAHGMGSGVDGSADDKLDAVIELLTRIHDDPTPVRVKNTEEMAGVAIKAAHAVLESDAGLDRIDRKMADALTHGMNMQPSGRPV